MWRILLNKNGNNFLINVAACLVVFVLKSCLTLFSNAVATGCVNDCFGISGDMHDTLHASI
jgi:phosphate starvation-inducible membrane PsiE